MRYHLVAVGRVKHAALRAACDDYRTRLARYARVEEREVKDDGHLVSVVDGGRDTRLVALSRAGQAWSSKELAEHTAQWDMDGRDVTFAIGGADGLPAPVLARAERVWSLSPLTLPHELARVIVYEQLYRAYTIRRGEPYHRGS